MSSTVDQCSVKVAVRIRPLVNSEVARGCKDILDVVEENNQIVVKAIEKDKAFTFNYVLSPTAEQHDLYEKCVQPLVDNIFKGFNVTILAYGQTGSGKTHSMGTAYKGDGDMGVIPRIVKDMFDFVNDNFSYNFVITVSFLEIYQEIVYDLLTDKSREQTILDIREDPQKGVYIPGLTELPASSVEEVLNILQKGSLGRATGSTAMNSHSSRSHAVLTVNLSMNHKTDTKQNKQAKLHLVDLAGSERPKKTGAVGNTFKEGVNINKGLFVLGNVISCLGDEKSQNGYIPYRDSNLTRLLKDSLGGNSITLMIACVSPADYNVDETLSTLRYADRARKIKNKPVINQDPRVAEINDLKKTIQQLRLQILGQGGPVVSASEIDSLKAEIITQKLKIRDLTCQLSTALVDNTSLHEKLIIFQNLNDALNKKIQELREQYDLTFTNISLGLENNDTELIKQSVEKLQNIQQQFVEINSEQKKAEEEIREHEVSFNQHLMREEKEGDQKEFDENHELHTKRQMDLNMQLTEIQKQLIIKEGLAKQLNTQYMIDYDAMAENEAKIANLQREKEELMDLLKNVGNSGKLSEQRKKRVEELEQQLNELKKKVTEQARLIKLKAGNEEKINRLNNEIVQMKQAKVKLIKTMREESDKFRQWRLQKERECIRLKEQDRKKANEITKIKAMHDKQQIVFRRRMEQAEALNKRLKSALAMRQQVQDVKNTGKAEKVEPWLKQEYEVFVHIVEAEATLKQLLEDRAATQHKLDELNANPETADSPEAKSLAEELELRSVQIQDIQQKLLDSDDDNKPKLRLDKLQTMAEAKFALKFLSSKLAKVHKERVLVQNKLSETQDNVDDLSDKLKSAESHIEVLKEQQAQELVKIQEEYEVFRALTKETEDLKKIEELQNVIALNDVSLKAKDAEIQQLRKKIEMIEECARVHKAEHKTPLMEENKKKKRVLLDVPKENVMNTSFTIVKDEEQIDDLEGTIVEDDDVENDPDWRKTPLGKRIIEEKRKMSRMNLDFDSGDGPAKRASDGGCTCKTDCSRARCGCKKIGRNCDPSCRCSQSVCLNRTQESNESPKKEIDQEILGESEDDNFKKPRIYEENVTKRTKKKSRQLFSLPV